jgi:hypothetical protein
MYDHLDQLQLELALLEFPFLPADNQGHAPSPFVLINNIIKGQQRHCLYAFPLLKVLVDDPPRCPDSFSDACVDLVEAWWGFVSTFSCLYWNFQP